MEELEEPFSEEFQVNRRAFPGSEIELSLFKEDRMELVVTGDRMRVHMNTHRAIMNKYVEGSFTRRDMKLREMILELYPRSRPTPFPWGYSYEDKKALEE